MKKLLLKLLILLGLVSCDNTQQSGSSREVKVDVPNETLLVSSKGRLANFNLETKKITWEYVSKEDAALNLNRNLFSYDSENIYLPFESGRFISAQINSGKINWNLAPQTTSFMNQIMDASMDENGEIQFDEQSSEYVVFMSQPLIYDEFVYIASCKRDATNKSKFYIFNKKDGSTHLVDENSTHYNFFKPVENNSNIYTTSAIYLDMHYKHGTFAGYGLYEDAAFENPLYIQIQANKNSLFLGDDKGVIYALAVGEIGLEKKGDISDPKNNFIDRKDLFEWKYKSEKYRYVYNLNTVLTKDFYIVNLRAENEQNDAIIALNIENGKEAWIYENEGQIENWHLVNDKITAFTNDKLFMIDLNGKLLFELPTTDKNLAPISNIEINNQNNLIYLSINGIVEVNIETKKTELIIPYESEPGGMEQNQIKYFK